ncbi:MAG: LCP family protein [Treponema sp.]|jgi:anionic cell wall polymer biosynthesis LytR-Cps2A-Psr (LCP) family protein|nr:LCP family protein [Treponema sp.]
MKNKHSSMDASIILLIVIGLIVIAGAVFAIIALRSDPLEEVFAEDSVINTLMIIEKDGKPLSSFVLMYYPSTKRASVFDVPGEIGLIIQRINRVDRIDAVYVPQRIHPFEQELSKLLGVDIDFSIVFKIENLGKLVDLMDGVEIFIPSPVQIYGENGPILFPSGMVKLDGEKAEQYISYILEEDDGDNDALRRQRFFKGFLKTLGEKSEYLQHPRIARIFNTFLESDMNQRFRDRLFSELAYIDTDRMNVQSVGGNARDVSGQELIIPFFDGAYIKDVVRQTLVTLTRQGEGSLADRVFTVEILNGTPTSGLARRTSELIQGFGYDVITVGNADNSDYVFTEIIDRSGIIEIGDTFADIIQCENITRELYNPQELDSQSMDYKADFTLIIGRDFNGRYVTN